MEEFYSIVPRQPYRPEDTPSEVRLEFEAVLLDGSTNNPTSNQLWIHARIKACVNGADCVPVRNYLTHPLLVAIGIYEWLGPSSLHGIIIYIIVVHICILFCSIQIKMNVFY